MTHMAPDNSTRRDHIFSNGSYDVLKFVAQIVLPALGALYFSLSQIWGLPNGEEVIGTITVVDTFLGVLLGISTHSYNKSDSKYDGAINVREREDGVKEASLVLNNYADPGDVIAQKEVIFKVNPS